MKDYKDPGQLEYYARLIGLNLEHKPDRQTLADLINRDMQPLVDEFYPDGKSTTLDQRTRLRVLQTCAIQLLDLDEALEIPSLG